jgi:heme/copper-type cytochrome/quinol oxidase subunit 4
VTVVEEIQALRGSHRYLIVFLLVLAIIMVAIGLPPDNSGRGVVMVALTALTLLAAVWVSGTTAWTPRIVACLAVFAAAVALLTWLLPGVEDEVGIATRLVVLSVVIVLPFVIGGGAIRAMKEDGVTLGVVFAAVSNYLLIAVGFAVVYAITSELQSAPFFAGMEPMKFGFFPDFMYFSVITQSTVGYGDFAPATGAGRAFASAQALIGQLYLVSVVAVVVGNFGRGTERQRQAEQQKLQALQKEVKKLESGDQASTQAKEDAPGD